MSSWNCLQVVDIGVERGRGKNRWQRGTGSVVSGPSCSEMKLGKQRSYQGQPHHGREEVSPGQPGAPWVLLALSSVERTLSPPGSVTSGHAHLGNGYNSSTCLVG